MSNKYMQRFNKSILLGAVTLLFFGCLLICGGCITSGNSNSGNPNDSTNDPSGSSVILSAPENLQIDFWELTWDKVENAVSYTVGVTETGDEFETESTSYNLLEYMDAGKTYTVYVIANGDGKDYLNSDYTEIEYTTRSATKLVYNLLEDGTYAVRGVDWGSANVSDGRVVIPDTYKGKTVTQIGDQAFYHYVGLSAIRLPAGLKKIGSLSFNECSISKIHFPSTLEEIDDGAFQVCANLREVVILNKVKRIGHTAFQDCSSLTEIVIPDSVTYIGNYAFQRCNNLAKIQVSESVANIGWDAFSNTVWYETQEDGFIYINSVLYKYKGIMPENTVIDNIPSFVQSISGGAFEDCLGLTKIVIPEGWTSLGYSLDGQNIFDGCVNLKEVILPDSLTSVGDAIFKDCTSLTHIKLPSNLKIISYGMFMRAGLTEITIPESVTSIGNSAFKNCVNLTSIVIPNSVTEIEDALFQGCTGLQKVVLSKNITTIPILAFDGCKQLTEIVISESVTSIGRSAFHNCANLTNIVIPEGVTSIENSAFNNCAKLASIVIPKSVINIGAVAFNGCENLTDIYYLGTEEEWKQVEFESDTSDPTYYGTLYYYSETQPEEDGNYWHYDVDGITPVIWTKEN